GSRRSESWPHSSAARTTSKYARPSEGSPTIVSHSCGNESDRRRAAGARPSQRMQLLLATSDGERDDAAMSTRVRATTVSALILTIVLVGCARQPSVTSMAAAPSPPRDSERPAVAEGRQKIVVAERPEPATFAENA